MQTREYDEKDGLKLWLSTADVDALLSAVENPRRRIALGLGLHGLRTDELVTVSPGDLRSLDGGGNVLVVDRDGKTGTRDVPLSDDLAQQITYLADAAQLRQDEPVIDVGKRQVRNWIEAARESVAASEYPREPAQWHDLGMHDLRRTWATSSYYDLAVRGVPIAEQLVMSWGGWAQTESGRDTFRSHYLGPVPDEVVNAVREDPPLP